MPLFPADGRIVAADSIGQQIMLGLRDTDRARQTAARELAQTGDIYAFENTMRAVRGDRAVRDGDLHLVRMLEGLC